MSICESTAVNDAVDASIDDTITYLARQGRRVAAIVVTMNVYAEAPSPVTRRALKQLGQ